MCRSLAVLRHRLPLSGRPLVPAALRSALGTSSPTIFLWGPKIFIPVMFDFTLPSAGSCCGSWGIHTCYPTSGPGLQAARSALTRTRCAITCADVSGPPPCAFRSRTGHPAHRDYTGLAAAQLSSTGSVSSLVSFRIHISCDRIMSQSIKVTKNFSFILPRGAIAVLAGPAL